MTPTELISRAEARLEDIYRQNLGLEVDVAALEVQLAIAKLLVSSHE